MLLCDLRWLTGHTEMFLTDDPASSKSNVKVTVATTAWVHLILPEYRWAEDACKNVAKVHSL